MNLKGLSGGQYRPLSPQQMNTIHAASLKILESIGITYEPGLEATLAMLEDAGATVDHKRSRITFPAKLVEAQAARAPEQVILYSRDGKNDLDLSRDHVYLGTGGAAINILDPESGQVRPSTLNDL